MDIATDHPVLVSVVDQACKECMFMEPLLNDLATQNSELQLEIATFDAWDDPEAVVAFEATTHPTFVLFVHGHEKARLVGAATKRQMLRKFLPYLYGDSNEALEQLRLQTNNPSETFPGRRRGWIGGGRSPDKVGLLKQVPLFSTLSKRQLSLIARYTDDTTAIAGQVIAEEGAEGEEFFLLVEGTATVTRNGHEIATLRAGDFFGEMALLDGQSRSAAVRVDEDSTLLAIHQRDFDYLLDEVPGIAREMLATVTRRLREADEKLAS